MRKAVSAPRGVVAATASLLVFILASGTASALTARDEFAHHQTWVGSVDYFASGAALAIDADGDGAVDTLAQPASFDVTTSDVPASALLDQAYLYWAGSNTQVGADCANPPDDTVTFTAPAGVPVSVTALVTYCAGSLAATYDMWVMRADVTSLIGPIVGTYTLGDFTARVEDNSADNASFSIVLVYREASLPNGRVDLFDGSLDLLSTSLPGRLGSPRGLRLAPGPSINNLVCRCCPLTIPSACY